MAADIERQVNIELNLDSSGAEKKYNDVIKKIEEPVKIEIDADVKKAIESIKELQQTLKALTNQGKDGEKLRINVAGIANLQQQLKTIDSTLGTLTNHFTGLRRSVDIQSELNDNRRSLEAYKNSFTGVVEQIDKLKTNRSTDDFFGLKKTKNNIRDIMNNNDFATIYEWSESNVSRLLVEIAKAANETDGLAKSIQISENQSVTLGDVFQKITGYISESKQSLDSLQITGLSAEIIDTLGNIQKLENEIPTLQAKFDDAVNREKAGSINVQIDSKSIEELSNTISELKGVFKVDDGSTIGIKEDDINKITESFTNLQTVLENIHSLLESFDVPRIKVPEIEKQESKPAHESRQTTTVSSTIPTINGGTRTISHTNDSSVSTSGTTGIDSAIDGQNRLQQEYRETRQEASQTADAIGKLGQTSSAPVSTTSAEYVKKTDYEIYSSAMEMAKNRESILETIGQREIDLAKKTSGETRDIYQKMVMDTSKLIREGVGDGEYKIDDKILQTKQYIQDLETQIQSPTEPAVLSMLNEQLDEAKIKLIALVEVFNESANRVKVSSVDVISAGSEAADKYSRSQRQDYEIAGSHFSIARDDKEYFDNLTKGIQSEHELTEAIEQRKQALAELEEKRAAAEEKTLSFDLHSAEYQAAFDNEMRITESYNEARQNLYNLIQLQQNWGKSMQEASQIDTHFLSTEWREEEVAFGKIDDAINKIIEDKKRMNAMQGEVQKPVDNALKVENMSLQEKLNLLKEIKNEYKFMETAEDRRIDMEEKAWDVGGNNPKSNAESQRKIDQYETLVEHISTAEDKLKEFEEEYSKIILLMKSGEKIQITDFVDLVDTSLNKSKIKDVQLLPNYEGYIQDAVDDMRRMDDWIDENVNRQMRPPVVWGADSQEEIKTAIQQLTEFKDKAQEIARHDGFSELSASMQDDVVRTIEYFEKIIQTEQRLLETQKQFDAQNNGVSVNKFAEQARDNQAKLSNETPVSTQEVSASEQAVESHERATQAALEHADAARQALEAEGQKPAPQDISGTEAQANANRDEANAAQEAAQAEKERADAAQSANEVSGHVGDGSSQVEASVEAHERAAEAAQHHAEEAKKAAEAESEQPSEPSTSNTEKQIEANQAEAESAREAAQAEQEKQDVIASQSTPASNQANAVQQGAGQVIQSLTDEEAALDRFKDKLQTEIPNAVDTKTQAFRSEQVEVENLVSLEESSLQRLVDALQRVADKATEINSALGQIGKDNNFSSFLNNIKENEQALIAFAEVLKKTNEEQTKAIDNTKLSNAKVINEKPVDPSQWRTVIDRYDEFIQKLGGLVDVREQIRRDEATGKEYISYRLKGSQGDAIIGKNGRILRENTQYSNDYTQDLQRQKERADIIKQAYGEIIKSIDDYKQTVTDLNNFEAQSSKNGTVDLERRKELYAKMAEAAQKAADSVKMAFALTDMGDITPKQMADVQSKYDQAKFGSEKSQKDREVAARNAAYKEQIGIIEQATSAMNKYNDALTKDIKGESVFGAEARTGMSEEINRTSGAADIAIGKIRELGEQGKITAEQLASAEMKYRESWTGSDSSIKSMQNAINQRNAQQEKSWAEMEKQQIQEATKAIDDYYKTANKGRELQIQGTIGQSAKAGGQLNDQITAMNDLKTSVEGYLNTLKQLNASGNTTVSNDFLKQYEDRITAANEIQQNLLTDSGKVGFENTEKQFETLIQYAQRYYDILHKPEENRTYADKNFLLDYGKYYEDAIKQAEQFAKSSDEAQKKMGESFLKSMDNANVENYKNILNNVGQEIDKLQQKQWTKTGSDELDNMSKQYDALYQKLQQFSKLSPDELSKFKEELANILKMQGEFSSGKYTPANPTSATKLSTNMSNFMANNSAASMYFPQIRALQDALKSPDLNGEQLSEIASKFNQIRQAAADAGKMGRSFGDALKKSFSGLTRYMATYVSFYRIIGAVKSAIATVKEFDTALMEVRKVSTETLSTLQQWQKTTFDMANSVGGSAIQIQKSTASWLRLGKDFQEAQKAAQASTKLLNVSEFTNIDDATKSLVSISQAYKDLTYDDVIDKLNNVGDHFSSSTDQLAQGLQNAAAVLKTQGNSIDEALALLTAGNDITQDISKTSAGIRTIALRISGKSVPEHTVMYGHV